MANKLTNIDYIKLNYHGKTNGSAMNFIIETMFEHLRQGEWMQQGAMKIGENMKKQVLNRGNWLAGYDLDQSGGFRQALSGQIPKYQLTDNGFEVGFGNVEEMNRVTRPAQIVVSDWYRTLNPNIRHALAPKKRNFQFAKGTFPIWLTAEFGTRSRKDNSPMPSEFRGSFGGTSDPSKTDMTRQPVGKPSGHRKPIWYMINPKTGAPGKPHYGQYPSKPFRRGLQKSRDYSDNIVKNIISLTLRDLKVRGRIDSGY